MVATSPNFDNYFEIFLGAIQKLPNDIDFIAEYDSYQAFINQLFLIKSGNKDSLTNKSIEEVVGEFIYKFETEYKQKVDEENKKIVENQQKPKQIDPKTVNNVLNNLGKAILEAERIETSVKQAEKQKVIPGNVVSRSLRRISISFKKTLPSKPVQTRGFLVEPQGRSMYASYAQKAKAEVPKSYLESNIATLKKDSSRTEMLQKNLIELFNLDPKRAIAQLDPNTPESIADFLHSPTADGVNLDKKKIGEYLGGLTFPRKAKPEADMTTDDKRLATRRAEVEQDRRAKLTPEERIAEDNKRASEANQAKINETILEQYVDKFDFKNQELVPALRKFLAEFLIPGESDPIDRIVGKFSQKFYKQNKEANFENEDSIHILAMSIVLLNVDAHNPNIAADKRMSAEAFIRNLRGLNNGKDFETQMLTDIYNDITGKVEGSKGKIKLRDEAEETPRTSTSIKT